MPEDALPCPAIFRCFPAYGENMAPPVNARLSAAKSSVSLFNQCERIQKQVNLGFWTNKLLKYCECA